MSRSRRGSRQNRLYHGKIRTLRGYEGFKSVEGWRGVECDVVYYLYINKSWWKFEEPDLTILRGDGVYNNSWKPLEDTDTTGATGPSLLDSHKADTGGFALIDDEDWDYGSR